MSLKDMIEKYTECEFVDMGDEHNWKGFDSYNIITAMAYIPKKMGSEITVIERMSKLEKNDEPKKHYIILHLKEVLEFTEFNVLEDHIKEYAKEK
jgi:hypothetical protein